MKIWLSLALAFGALWTLAVADPPNPNGTPAPAATSGARSFSAATFSVTLDGIAAGTFKRMEGGDVVADVVIEKLGTDQLQKKHIGNIKYNDIKLLDGIDEKNLFCTWWATRRLATPNPKEHAAGSPAPTYVVARRNLEVAVLDAKGKETRHLTVYNAVPTKLLGDCRGVAGTTLQEVVLQPEMTKWTTVKP
jgi:hypothetical protein